MDDNSARAAQRLQTFLVDWQRTNPGWALRTNPETWTTEYRSAGDVARDLLSAADADQLRLAGFLRSPDGELVRTVVARLLPWPESAEFRLLVDAVLLAAGEKTRGERVLVGGLAGVACLLMIAGSLGI